MHAVDSARLDLVCRSHPDMRNWSWAALHQAQYGQDLRGALVAACILSKPAACFLRARRRVLALHRQLGSNAFWPFCEAFIPTELARAGFRCGEFATFTDVTRYRWRPVIPESELRAGIPNGILHPVRPDGDAGRYSLQT